MKLHRKKGIRYKRHLGIYKGVAGVAGLKMALWKMIHESRCPQCRCKLTFIPNEQRWFCKNCNKIFPQKDKRKRLTNIFKSPHCKN